MLTRILHNSAFQRWVDEVASQLPDIIVGR